MGEFWSVAQLVASYQTIAGAYEDMPQRFYMSEATMREAFTRGDNSSPLVDPVGGHLMAVPVEIDNELPLLGVDVMKDGERLEAFRA